MTKNPPLLERLKNGAKKLGDLWRRPEERCPAAWSLDPCSCEPLKKFCQGRNLWITLAIEADRDFQDGPHGLALMMTDEEWDSTCLGLKMNHPEAGEIMVGTGPGCVITRTDLKKLTDLPDVGSVLIGTLKVLRAFPKARIEGVLEPAVVEQAVEAVE